MEILRTPDERFEGLTDYDFAPHYRQVTARDGSALRLHFLDEGPRDAAPVLLLHGNPAWCYLYRHMIPALVARGHRVVALDLMGMGRSDKPVDQGVFTLAQHVDWMGQWFGRRGPDGHHAVLPGLGRDRRAQSAAAPRRPVRPGGGVQYRPPGGEGHEQVPRGLAGLQPVGRRAARRRPPPGRHHPPADPRGGGRLRGALPRRVLPGQSQAVPDAHPRPARQPGGSPGRGHLVLSRDVPEALPHRVRRPGSCGLQGRGTPAVPDAHPGGGGPAAPVLEGASHFIQEDAPDELVAIIDAFVRAEPA